MKQLSFFRASEFPKEFGGTLLQKKRKSRRPLALDKAVHLVLRAAEGSQQAFLKSRGEICFLIEGYAKRFDVKIYRKGLVWDHVHFLVKFSTRENYANFVRTTTGVVARKFA